MAIRKGYEISILHETYYAFWSKFNAYLRAIHRRVAKTSIMKHVGGFWHFYILSSATSTQ